MRLSEVLKAAKADGHTMVCYYDDPADADYTGTSTREAKKALEACDVMNLVIRDTAGKQLAWIHIVNEFEGDPEEQIADYTMTDWMRKHWPSELDF